MKILPESWRKCLSAKQRREIGQPTIEESKAKGVARLERDLQRQIVQDLRRRGFEVLWHATHCKSTATVGWPDITFAHYGTPVAIEVKTQTGRLSAEQAKTLQKMVNGPNLWKLFVIRS